MKKSYITRRKCFISEVLCGNLS